MNILALGASSSRHSINQQLAIYTARLVEHSVVETVDLNDYEMPIYSSDKEKHSGIPKQAHELFERIGNTDAVVISFAEHNASYTAAYKNIYDWMSRIDMKVYQNKPVLVLATSPGPGGASNVFNSALKSAPYFGMDVKGSLSVASFYDQFDAASNAPTSGTLEQQLQHLAKTLVASDVTA
ncbi:NADPH-dependent FMN reductase [Echinimonas agarilytica]|uniref:NAD(P)H-dependent oxidoreductase n=1 Tax=Echinimonas agarilytica TaxID=1215918 RepID=A0AA41W8I9_9GAMM|nr:NADPH-dependent FMN reductase [Echinimonas agarilytica]MCM2680668.1 NAD(P)H-dependent oxidoreductase [Echinimonas agarilytica]